MAFLTREKLLSHTPRVLQTVKLADGEVGIRTLSGAEREQFEKVKDDEENRNDVRAYLVALAVTDGDGVNLFKREDVDLINRTIDGPTLATLYMAALEVNVVTQEAYDIALGKSTAPPSA